MGPVPLLFSFWPAVVVAQGLNGGNRPGDAPRLAAGDKHRDQTEQGGEEKDGRVYVAFIRLTTLNRVHLANIMRKIRIMPDVIKVTRNRN